MNHITERIILIIRICITGIVIIECAMQSDPNIWMKTALVCGIVLLFFHDILRHYRIRYQFRISFILSIIVSIIGAGLYAYWLNSLPAGIYYLFPLIELIINCKRILYPLIILHTGIFVLANYMLKDLTLNNLALYFSVTVVIFLCRKNIDEKRKITLLNQELMIANQQLTEYAAHIEKTAKIKERTHIAQEMHDSIGHELVALSMHLEFIQQTLGINIEKAAVSVDKAYVLSLKCIQDLRSAVSILKEDKEDTNLRLSITELIDNVSQSAKIMLTFDDLVEKVSLDLKSCIYKMIREALTNSLKHGNATNIQIEVTNNEPTISVMVKDNGTGCDYVIKSHGLSAIEERAARLGGRVTYQTGRECGFLLRMEIPVESKKELI